MPGGLNPAVFWFGSDFGNGVFVAVGNNLSTTGNPASAWSLDGISWNQVLPAAGGLPDGAWQSVTFGNGIFVASQGTRGPHGNGPGTAYSADGKTWRTDNTDIPQSTGGVGYNTICYSTIRSEFLTLGYGVAESYTSTNGYTWTAQPFADPPQYNYSQVVAGSDRYVAVGTAGTAGYLSMYIMFGASTWVVGTSTLPFSFFGLPWFKSIAYSLGVFYTFDSEGANIYSSTDGYTWVATTTVPFHVSDVAFNPSGNWVIVGSGNIAYSDNPLGPYTNSGPPSVVTASYWFGVNFAGGKYIALGPSGSQGNGYSYDGIVWNIANAPPISFGLNWFYSP